MEMFGLNSLKSSGSVKRAVLITKEELYMSFQRALKGVASIEITRYSIKFMDKQEVVMYIIDDNNKINSWLWGGFRKKALNPLIVIGIENKESFINKNPLFADYSEEHAYIQIPFDLAELLSTINRLKPIYDNVTRKLIVNDYSKGYEHKLITHDLKIIKGDKQATMNNLLAAKNFYHAKGDREILKIIDGNIKEIQMQDDWEQIAMDTKQYLEETLRTRSKL